MYIYIYTNLDVDIELDTVVSQKLEHGRRMRIMAQYPQIQTKASIGPIILGMLEVQTHAKALS